MGEQRKEHVEISKVYKDERGTESEIKREGMSINTIGLEGMAVFLNYLSTSLLEHMKTGKFRIEATFDPEFPSFTVDFYEPNSNVEPCKKQEVK